MRPRQSWSICTLLLLSAVGCVSAVGCSASDPPANDHSTGNAGAGGSGWFFCQREFGRRVGHDDAVPNGQWSAGRSKRSSGDRRRQWIRGHRWSGRLVLGRRRSGRLCHEPRWSGQRWNEHGRFFRCRRGDVGHLRDVGRSGHVRNERRDGPSRGHDGSAQRRPARQSTATLPSRPSFGLTSSRNTPSSGQTNSPPRRVRVRTIARHRSFRPSVTARTWLCSPARPVAAPRNKP